MNTSNIQQQRPPPWWRAGIFPLVWLTLICSLGFLVQLPVAIELHAVAADTADRHRIQDAQHATTIAMALGASALLAGMMLRDRIRNEAAPLPASTTGDRTAAGAEPIRERHLNLRRPAPAAYGDS